MPAERRPGTIAALIAAYQSSPEWAALAESRRADWTRYLKHVTAVWGDDRVEALEPRHVLALRDSYADIPPAPPATLQKPIEEYANRPAAANNLLRVFSAMLGWSIPRGWRTDNPCEHVPKFQSGDGYDPWSWDEIELFRKVAAKRFAGYTDAQVRSITGQSQDMIEHYARRVNQRHLAAAAILKWEAAEKVRTSPSIGDEQIVDRVCTTAEKSWTTRTR